MYRIITVCTGNICRSPMAAYLIRRAAGEAGLDGVVVSSAGISDEERGNPVDPRARTVLVREGIDPSDHAARPFEAAELAEADLVLALDVDHERALQRMAADEGQQRKIRLLREFDPAVAHREHGDLGIYDPWYGDPGDFQATYEMIRDAVPGVIEFAAQQSGSRSGTA